MRRIPMALVLIYILLAVCAQLGWIASEFDVVNNSLSYLAPSQRFWFGTDVFGRSVLARSIHAAKNALAIGCFSTLIALLIGTTLGAIAGYFGKWLDELIVWFYTTLDSIPYILLLASFALLLGQGFINLFLALGLTGWTTLCKIVRNEFHKQKNLEYVLAAKSQGFSSLRIIFKHILPNVAHLIVVQAGIIFISAIKIEVILTYLGLGMEPGSPSWGLMIDDAKQEITRGIWWNMSCSTISMFILFFCVNLLIEDLRKKFDIDAI